MLLGPEAELVLRSAKLGDHPVWPLITERPIEWGVVAAVAADERATFVLSQKLPPDLPVEAASAFRKIALVESFRVAHLNSLLDTTLTSLERLGIETMLLKGSALVARGIATTAERPMNDIDILVAPDEVERAWQSFQRVGWRWDADRFPAHLYEHQHHLPPLVDASGSGYRLEVHRDVFRPEHPFLLRSSDLWNQGEVVVFGKHRVRVPDIHHSMVHAAVHFAWAHIFGSKAWRTFRDLELIAGRAQMSWSALGEVARTTRAASCVYWTLRMASSVVGTHVPHTVMDALRPPRPESVLKRLEKHYVRGMTISAQSCPSNRLNQLLWELGICPEHEGHGGARPWHGSFSIPEADAWQRSRTSTNLAGRFKQSSRLVRYLWGLV